MPSNDPMFVVNKKGGIHSVPFEWVTIDSVGAVFVRGNGGYRLASDDEVNDWYEAQGLNKDEVGQADSDDEDAVDPQPDNFTVEDPEASAKTVGNTPGDAKVGAKK